VEAEARWREGVVGGGGVGREIQTALQSLEGKTLIRPPFPWTFASRRLVHEKLLHSIRGRRKKRAHWPVLCGPGVFLQIWHLSLSLYLYLSHLNDKRRKAPCEEEEDDDAAAAKEETSGNF